MYRRQFVGYGCTLSLLSVTGGCLSEGQEPHSHTETMTVYNRLDRKTTVSLDVQRSGKQVFSGRESILASASWEVPEEFGSGTYELAIEVSGGPSATKSWDVPDEGPNQGLGIEIGQSGIETTLWVD
jgi:hypothetical protein